MPFVRITNTNLKKLLQSPESKLPSNSWMAYEEKGIQGDYESDKYPSPPRPVKAFDIVAGGTAGGGGYGDPLERDPLLVMKDLEDGVVSHRVATEIYRVSYNRETLMVDQDETAALRQKEREERKKRGVPFEDFERKWRELKPPDEMMEFYGDWPETKYESFTYFGEWHGTEDKE